MTPFGLCLPTQLEYALVCNNVVGTIKLCGASVIDSVEINKMDNLILYIDMELKFPPLQVLLFLMTLSF